MCDSDNSLEGPPPAPVPSRNASHTSLCSLDLSRYEPVRFEIKLNLFFLHRDGFGPSSILVNRVQDSSFHPLRRTESSASVMCFDEASNSSLASCPPLLSHLFYTHLLAQHLVNSTSIHILSTVPRDGH